MSNSVKKRMMFTFFASILLIASGVESQTFNSHSVSNFDNTRESTTYAILKSSCSVTHHPELCYSTLSETPEMLKKVNSQKDVIELAINKTKEIVQRNHFTIKKLTLRTNLTKRGKIALHDCLELVADTLEELNQVIGFLKTYPSKKGVRKYVDDLLTLMSTTLTNQVNNRIFSYQFHYCSTKDILFIDFIIYTLYTHYNH